MVLQDDRSTHLGEARQRNQAEKPGLTADPMLYTQPVNGLLGAYSTIRKLYSFLFG